MAIIRADGSTVTSEEIRATIARVMDEHAERKAQSRSARLKARVIEVLEEARKESRMPTYVVLADRLNQQGITTPTGLPWTCTRLVMTLRNWGIKREGENG